MLGGLSVEEGQACAASQDVLHSASILVACILDLCLQVGVSIHQQLAELGPPLARWLRQGAHIPRAAAVGVGEVRGSRVVNVKLLHQLHGQVLVVAVIAQDLGGQGHTATDWRQVLLLVEGRCDEEGSPQAYTTSTTIALPQ